MNEIEAVYNRIVHDLKESGKISLYSADANEPDSRYKAYGVRAAQKKEIYKTHRPAVQRLALAQQIDVATRLIKMSLSLFRHS